MTTRKDIEQSETRLLAASLAALTFCGLATPASADPYRLRFNAEPECADASVFTRAVSEQVGASPFSAQGETPVIVELWSTADGAVGELILGARERRIQGRGCAQVLETLALIVAVSLDAGPAIPDSPPELPAEPERSGWVAMAREVDRPMTMPAGVLRTELHAIFADLPNFGNDEVSEREEMPGEAALGFALAAGYGITDDLEVGIDGTRVGLAPSSGVGIYADQSGSGTKVGMLQPTLYGRYRYFASDNVELGVDISLEVPFLEGFVASLGLLHLRVREGITALDFRVDVSAVEDTSLGGFDPVAQGLLRIRFNMGDHVYGGGQVEGKVIGRGFDGATVHAGVGLVLGSTIDLETALVDLSVGAHLPSLVRTVFTPAGSWLVDLGLAVYLPVGVL